MPIGRSLIPFRAMRLLPWPNLILMKLHAILLVLLCCFCGLTYASAGSLDDTSLPMDTPGPSAPVALPATSSSAILYRDHIYTYFAVELALEAAAIAVTLAGLGSDLACSIPELFFATLALTAIMLIAKVKFMFWRTKVTCESASTAAGLAHFNPTRQALIASVSGAIDFSRATALLYVMTQGPRYCDTDAHSTASWIFLVLMATILMGGVQLGMLVKHVHIWMRDMDEPFGLRLDLTECLQE